MWTGKGEPTKGANLLKFIQPVQVVTDCSDLAFINKCFLKKKFHPDSISGSCALNMLRFLCLENYRIKSDTF